MHNTNGSTSMRLDGRAGSAAMAAASVSGLLPRFVAVLIITTLLVTARTDAAVTVSTTGARTIDLDTRFGGPAQAFTAVDAPAPRITEGAAGDISAGLDTIVINVPVGFAFSVVSTPAANVIAGNMVINNVAFTNPTVFPGQIFVDVATASTVPSTIEFVGIQIRPNGCTALGNHNILVTTDAGGAGDLSGATLATLTLRAGPSINHYTLASNSPQPSQSPITVTLSALDGCNNPIPNAVVPSDITLSVPINGTVTWTSGAPFVLSNINVVPNTATIAAASVFSAAGTGTFAVTNQQVCAEDTTVTATHAGGPGTATAPLSISWTDPNPDSDGDGVGDVCDTCTDVDGDGVGDAGFVNTACAVSNGPDNCPAVANSTQADADGDGVGDSCDTCTDVDGDGVGDAGFVNTTCPVSNGPDNCSNVANPTQIDMDLDGLGDDCDVCPLGPNSLDADGDGVADACDNCPVNPNGPLGGPNNQDDTDADGVGDVCDICPGFDDILDTDADGVADGCDNCPLVANGPLAGPNNQSDADADGVGDLCDTCTDVDGDGVGDPGFVNTACAVTNGPDNCPAVANPTQTDSDGDGDGDDCDPDDDADGILDVSDNCILIVNADQKDSDGDGIGDVCDGCTDADADGVGDPGFTNTVCAVSNGPDNCPIANASQADADGDGAGDACDPCPADAADDTDGDGVCDSADGCPNDVTKIAPGACGCGNPDTDGDNNGIPDCIQPPPAAQPPPPAQQPQLCVLTSLLLRFPICGIGCPLSLLAITASLCAIKVKRRRR